MVKIVIDLYEVPIMHQSLWRILYCIISFTPYNFPSEEALSPPHLTDEETVAPKC